MEELLKTIIITQRCTYLVLVLLLILLVGCLISMIEMHKELKSIKKDTNLLPADDDKIRETNANTRMLYDKMEDLRKGYDSLTDIIISSLYTDDELLEINVECMSSEEIAEMLSAFYELEEPTEEDKKTYSKLVEELSKRDKSE